MTLSADRTTRGLLLAAMAVPVLYFGVQFALVPTFEGYSVARDPTSLLGSDRSPHASWFNAVAVLSGLCLAAGAVGVFRALRGPAVLRWLLLLALLGAAVGNVWAGVFPMPDPRHGANPSTPAMLALPFLFAAGGLWTGELRALRAYLFANLLLFLALAPIMAGATPLDRSLVSGTLQRLIALTIFVPVGIVAWRLRR